MDLIFAHQIGFDHLKDKYFNYFITASGYENRCTYLIDSIEIEAGNRITLAFDDKKDILFREKNDKRFYDEGFNFIEESANKKDRVTLLLDEIFESHIETEKISILIDYSCMSKIWYAGMLEYFISKELSINNLEVYFSYTSAVFSEPVNPEGKVMLNSPNGLLSANIQSEKPLALILGLGYERFLTREIIDSINYKIIYVFYSDPAFDSRYADRVTKNNRQILRCLPEEHIYRYPVEDFKETDSLLTSLTMKLRLNYRVSILPAGPKPFTLSSLLLAARYPDIEVWSIDSGHAPAAYNRNPAGAPMVCKVLFSNDEDSFL
ncbi:MAG: hypothetical protein ACLFQA_07080 [Bacteroidales bacterium]